VSSSRYPRPNGLTSSSPRRIGSGGRHVRSRCRVCWMPPRAGCTQPGCLGGRRSTRTGWPNPDRGARDRRRAAGSARQTAGRGLPVRPSAVGNRVVAVTAGRPGRGLPRRCVRTQHVDRRRRPPLRTRRPGRPRHRRSVGRPGGGHPVAVRNHGGYWDGDLFEAYGVDPDAARVDHYRRL
jgi:hypothetical protein